MAIWRFFTKKVKPKPNHALFLSRKLLRDWRNELPHVLVIDDEKMISDLVKQALTRHRYMVETAQTAADGLQKMYQNNFDLIITDVCMPGNDDNIILGQIRRSQNRKVPVIGISGTPWMLNNLEFDLILPKPFSIKSLVESVGMLIGHAEAVDSKKVANG